MTPLLLNDPVRFKSGKGWAHGVVVGWANDGRGNVTGVVIQTQRGQRVTRREGSVEREECGSGSGSPVTACDCVTMPDNWTLSFHAKEGQKEVVLFDSRGTDRLPEDTEAFFVQHGITPVIRPDGLLTFEKGYSPTWLRDPVIVSALRAWASQPWQDAHGCVLVDRLEEMLLPAHAQTARKWLALAWRKEIPTMKRQRRQKHMKDWRRMLKMEYGDFMADTLACDGSQTPG